jgi:hypothetical protein
MENLALDPRRGQSGHCGFYFGGFTCFTTGVPSRAAKHAAESKQGQHNQSIEPSRPTKAAVLQSPISA